MKKTILKGVFMFPIGGCVSYKCNGYDTYNHTAPTDYCRDFHTYTLSSFSIRSSILYRLDNVHSCNKTVVTNPTIPTTPNQMLMVPVKTLYTSVKLPVKIAICITKMLRASSLRVAIFSFIASTFFNQAPIQKGFSKNQLKGFSR